jgi:GMP synthase PP-ATPase subunit
MINFRIFCEVHGGTTGYRCAYLKVKDAAGKKVEAVFVDQGHAQEECDKLHKMMNGPRALATFRYTVEDYGNAN